LHHAGIKEVNMRIACPPLTYACEFLNFSRSRSNLDLATHTAVKQLEGKEGVDMKEYSDSNDVKYKAMVEKIRGNLDLTSLTFQKLDDLVEAIGLPKEKLCTHCWDGSSYF
jgi:amidophosphoribosyltransferase